MHKDNVKNQSDSMANSSAQKNLTENAGAELGDDEMNKVSGGAGDQGGRIPSDVHCSFCGSDRVKYKSNNAFEWIFVCNNCFRETHIHK